MKQYRRVDLVLKYATIQCLAKPLYTAFRRPRSAWVGFRLASRAVFDGLTGKLGRRVEPVLEPSQPSTSSPRYEPVEMV